MEQTFPVEFYTKIFRNENDLVEISQNINHETMFVVLSTGRAREVAKVLVELADHIDCCVHEEASIYHGRG